MTLFMFFSSNARHPLPCHLARELCATSSEYETAKYYATSQVTTLLNGAAHSTARHGLFQARHIHTPVHCGLIQKIGQHDNWMSEPLNGKKSITSVESLHKKELNLHRIECSLCKLHIQQRHPLRVHHPPGRFQPAPSTGPFACCSVRFGPVSE